MIAAGEVNRLFVERAKEALPVKASLIPFGEMGSHPHPTVLPWGWNPSLRRKLALGGADPRLLPSPEELERLRGYSSRRHAVEMLAELQGQIREGNFCGESHFFTDAGSAEEWLQSVPGNKVLKMPLSGSGKGLVWILGEITDKQSDWCRRVVREQGGVATERVLDKVRDFAMEFYLHEGMARFAGYSLFAAAASGAYTGNELLSDARIEEELGRFVETGLLHRIREVLARKLAARFPLYTGYAGVDMMVCGAQGGYSLQPCVEINMRMNMGMVARIFHDRYLLPAGEGKFAVGYWKKAGGALAFHEKMQRESPLEVKDGKILSGYLPLTPVAETTGYVAYATVTPQE